MDRWIYSLTKYKEVWNEYYYTYQSSSPAINTDDCINFVP
jgi:hypothetical protein